MKRGVEFLSLAKYISVREALKGGEMEGDRYYGPTDDDYRGWIKTARKRLELEQIEATPKILVGRTMMASRGLANPRKIIKILEEDGDRLF